MEVSRTRLPLIKYHIGFLAYTFLWAGKNIYSSRILQKMDPILFSFWIGVIATFFVFIIRLSVIGPKVTYDIKNLYKYVPALILGTAIGLLGANYALTRM